MIFTLFAHIILPAKLIASHLLKVLRDYSVKLDHSLFIVTNINPNSDGHPGTPNTGGRGRIRPRKRGRRRPRPPVLGGKCFSLPSPASSCDS